MASIRDSDPSGAILGKLQRVRTVPGGWIASCPVPSHGKGNGDRNPSLSISEGSDGKALVNCMAGCSTGDVVQSIGLQTSDLFADSGKRPTPIHSSTRPRTAKPTGNTGESTGRTTGRTANTGFVHPSTASLTLADYAGAKNLPVAFLASVGLSDTKYNGSPAVRMLYWNGDGTTGATRYRVSLEKPDDGGDRFRWKSGSKIRPYGLERIAAAKAAGYVFLVEGESDCHAAWYNGVHAVGIPGASNFRDDRDAQHLDGIDNIYAVVEPDHGGETFRKKLAEASIRDRVLFVDLSPFGVKDVSALYVDDPTRFQERIEQAKANATPYADVEANERNAATTAAFTAARALLHTPDILSAVRESMRRRGYAGSLDPPMNAYVAITSRLLSDPLNMAFIAPSGAGKNRSVDEARAHIPDDAVHEIKAGSERSLIYSDASYQHRVVLFSEADSIPEEGPAASAVRNIASDNEMTYDVTEKDETTGKWHTRRITKPGPTSLITTSTKSLRHQFDTRVLEVAVPDDANQTRAVMRAHAASVNPSEGEDVDTAVYIALQRWIELAGIHDVAVPFADVLADELPNGAVRMRRDFRQLLTFVQAIALLHQCQRDRTPEGWIIATLADYDAARSLCLAIFDVSVSEGVTPAVREVVEAIHDREEISIAKLSERMSLAGSTLKYRVARALKGGWLVNNETVRGKPYKLAHGAPLPETRHALPTVDQLIATGRADESGKTTRPLVRPSETVDFTDKSTGPDEWTNESGQDSHPTTPARPTGTDDAYGYEGEV